MPLLSGWDPTKILEVTIPASELTSDLTDHALVLKFSSSSGTNNLDLLSIYDEVGSNSKRIAVTLENETTEFFVEVIHWASDRQAVAIKIPTITSVSDTVLFFYYDNSHADNTAKIGNPGDSVSQNAWDSNFKFVAHLGENPGGSAPQMLDSTLNNLDLTSSGSMTSDDLVTAKIGNGIEFDSNDRLFKSSGLSPLDITGELTLEVLFKAPVSWDTIDNGRLVDKFLFTDKTGYHLALISAGKHIDFLLGLTSGLLVVSTTTVFNNNTFYYVVGRYSSTTISIWTNGVKERETSFNNPIKISANDFALGRNTDGNSDHRVPSGTVIDEVRVSDVGRSDDYININYKAQFDTLVSYNLKSSKFILIGKGMNSGKILGNSLTKGGTYI